MKNNFSIKNRLLIQLFAITSILVITFFFTIKSFIGNTVISTQDGLLSASLGSIIKKIRVEQDEIYVDLPYDTFSILGSMKDDKVYYRFDLNNEFLTGYEDLPTQNSYGEIREPYFDTIKYRGEDVRLANVRKTFVVKNKEIELLISLGQTQNFQKIINNDVTKNMIIIFSLFSVIIIFLVLITTNSTIRPLNKLAKQVGSRGPKDLRVVKYQTPLELKPLVSSLNGLIQRFKGNLLESETFLAEAAHHIRTPLATVKAECELALRKSKNDKNRDHLINIIRSVEQTNRSSSQLLEQALVKFKSEKINLKNTSIKKSIERIIVNYKPAADLRDIKINLINNVNKDINLKIDQTLFEIAIRNLLDNAIKYSPTENDVDVTLEINGDDYLIKFMNISLNKLNFDFKNIMKRFSRGNKNEKVIGTGLGLSIVSEATKSLKGNLKVSKLKGNVFCAILYLPLS